MGNSHGAIYRIRNYLKTFTSIVNTVDSYDERMQSVYAFGGRSSDVSFILFLRNISLYPRRPKAALSAGGRILRRRFLHVTLHKITSKSLLLSTLGTYYQPIGPYLLGEIGTRIYMRFRRRQYPNTGQDHTAASRLPIHSTPQPLLRAFRFRRMCGLTTVPALAYLSHWTNAPSVYNH